MRRVLALSVAVIALFGSSLVGVASASTPKLDAKALSVKGISQPFPPTKMCIRDSSQEGDPELIDGSPSS